MKLYKSNVETRRDALNTPKTSSLFVNVGPTASVLQALATSSIGLRRCSKPNHSVPRNHGPEGHVPACVGEPRAASLEQTPPHETTRPVVLRTSSGEERGPRGVHAVFFVRVAYGEHHSFRAAPETPAAPRAALLPETTEKTCEKGCPALLPKTTETNEPWPKQRSRQPQSPSMA